MNFNSHAHVERDHCHAGCRKRPCYFNSHAHVERDLALADFATGWINFNSHAHVERDKQEPTEYHSLTISTHTLTWSVTGNYNSKDDFSYNFNSHAHVERDAVRGNHGTEI